MAEIFELDWLTIFSTCTLNNPSCSLKLRNNEVKYLMNKHYYFHLMVKIQLHKNCEMGDQGTFLKTARIVARLSPTFAGYRSKVGQFSFPLLVS